MAKPSTNVTTESVACRPARKGCSRVRLCGPAWTVSRPNGSTARRSKVSYRDDSARPEEDDEDDDLSSRRSTPHRYGRHDHRSSDTLD